MSFEIHRLITAKSSMMSRKWHALSHKCVSELTNVILLLVLFEVSSALWINLKLKIYAMRWMRSAPSSSAWDDFQMCCGPWSMNPLQWLESQYMQQWDPVSTWGGQKRQGILMGQKCQRTRQTSAWVLHLQPYTARKEPVAFTSYEPWALWGW